MEELRMLKGMEDKAEPPFDRKLSKVTFLSFVRDLRATHYSPRR